MTFVSFVATWCGKVRDKSEHAIVPGLAEEKAWAKCEDIVAKINAGRAGFTKFVNGFRLLFDNDFKGEGYGAGGADGFALQAPAAVIILNGGYHILRHDQGFTQAHADT